MGRWTLSFSTKARRELIGEKELNLLINIVAFKIGWLSAVFGGAYKYPLLGAAIVMVAIAIHLYFATERSREFSLVLLTGIIGLCSDSILMSAGWLTYTSGTFVPGLAPYWIVAMWMLFATTLNVTFRWLHNRLAFAAVLGAIAGPASYYAGSKIGAVTLTEFVPAMIGLSVAWAVLFPALLVLARQLDGTRQPLLGSRI